MNTEEIGQFLEKYDYDYFLDVALSNFPDDIDTREGSIAFDAVAPACLALAELALEMRNVMRDGFSLTSSGQYLDLKAPERGLTRLEATFAVAKAFFTKEDGSPLTTIELGTRFTSIGDEAIYYAVTASLGEGYYHLTAQEAGTVGNPYTGQLLPVDHVNDLAAATLVEVETPARDVETDESLRDRILKTYRVLNFGGNIEDYIQHATVMDGVGAVQIYPVWDGGGTVRVVVLDSTFDVPNPSLITTIQTAFSPSGSSEGYGIAPIGHSVTVAAPTKKMINVSLHVDTVVGKTLEEVKPLIQAKLTEHFLNIRKTWNQHDEFYHYGQVVYRSQLTASLLGLEDVANVSNVRLNGADGDVSLVLSNALQECAFLGTVSYT